MKPRRIFSAARLSLPFACALVALFNAHSAKAQTTRYWDGNNSTANFGSASGTWAAPTSGTATAGWSTSAAGTAVVLGNSITTLINDPLNFGRDTTGTGLGGGTITVSGTVDAASLRFGSQTTGNITLSGGTINLAAVTSIHVGAGGTTVQTISSSITGAGTSLTKTGNSLNLSGANSYTGSTIIPTGNLILGSTGALGSNPGVAGSSGVTIGGASAATLSSTLTGITIAAPITTANTGINSSISFGRSTAAAGSITLNGAIGGNGNVVFTTPNNNSGGNVQTVNLGAAATYAGDTTITTGNANNATSVRNASGAANVLPITTVLTMAGGGGAGTGRAVTFDLNGQNQELAGLTNTTPVPGLRNHRITSAAAATLTINNATDFSYGGSTVSGSTTTTAQITGAISLTKNGVGKFTLAAGSGNAFNGTTTILGGILSLGHPNSIQNSVFDTTASIAGDATNGLETALTTLTLGGLTGSNNFATRFTTTGGYGGLTALTLNPGTGVTHSYAADIGDGAGGMNLIKTGAGTQIFTVPQSHTGTTTATAGTLVAPSTAELPGSNVAGKVIFNGGTIGVQVGGAGWTTGDVDTLLSNATKTSGALGIDTTNGNQTQWTPFTTTNFGPTLGLNKLGANDLTLDQANTFTGATTITAGTLTLTNALALQNSVLVTTGAGSLVLSGVTTLNLAGLSGATGNLASVISSGYDGITAINLNTPATVAGSAFTYGGSITEGATGMTLTKTGVGIQVLSGANSYTGATQIDGGMLVFRTKAAKASATATAAAAGSIGLGVKAADAAFYSEVEVGDLFNTNTLTGFSLDPASGVAIDTSAGNFDQSVALTAARSLTKVGANTLTLSTANSYSGATDVLNGNLSVTDNSSLGTTAGATTIHGGQGTTANSLVLSSATTDLTIAENINFAASPVGRSQLSHQALSRFHTLTGNIDVTSDANIVQFSVNAASTDLATVGGVTISGDITGALTNGAGFLLRGATSSGVSAVNSITGNITLTGAGVVKTDANTWTLGAVGKTYTAPSIAAANGILKMGVADYITASAPELIMGNSSGGSTGVFDLNGFNQTVSGITYSGGASSTGTKTITNSDTVNTAVLTVNNTADFSPTGGTPANSVVLTGNLSLTKEGANTLTLSGLNSHTGNTVVNAGTLALADNAQLKFVLGATTGTNNSLSGAGTVTLDGDFVIDTAAADALAEGTWTLENVNSLTGAYGATFSVVGFTDAGGNKWTKANGPTKVYTFDEATGILTLETPGYASWASTNGTGQTIDLDHDGDGVQNGVEYFLGGPTGNTTGFTPLPGVANNAGTLSVTWIKGSGYLGAYGTDFAVETSTTLSGTWITADPGTAPGQADATTTPGQVKYTFPAGTRNFVRLRVTGP